MIYTFPYKGDELIRNINMISKFATAYLHFSIGFYIVLLLTLIIRVKFDTVNEIIKQLYKWFGNHSQITSVYGYWNRYTRAEI